MTLRTIIILDIEAPDVAGIARATIAALTAARSAGARATLTLARKELAANRDVRLSPQALDRGDDAIERLKIERLAQKQRGPDQSRDVTRAEPPHLFAGEPTQENHRDMRHGGVTELSARDVYAVHSGQHDIKNHQVVYTCPDHLQAGRAIKRTIDYPIVREPPTSQPLDDRGTHRRVIVDNQDPHDQKRTT